MFAIIYEIKSLMLQMNFCGFGCVDGIFTFIGNLPRKEPSLRLDFEVVAAENQLSFVSASATLIFHCEEAPQTDT
jgi:hypothetical protein